MSDKESDEQDRELAQEMLDRFQAGESKSTLEIEYWNDGTSHGKRFGSQDPASLKGPTCGRS